jgi:hypothetical protein
MRLEDHLLIEFANANGFAFAVSEEDAIKATIGNGAGVENGEPGSPIARSYDVAYAVPREPRAEFCEFV